MRATPYLDHGTRIDGQSTCVANVTLLADTFLQLRDSLPLADKTTLARALTVVNGNEETLDHAIGGARVAVARALAITRQILAFATIGQGDRTSSRCDLVHVLSAIVDEARASPERGSISIHMDAPNSIFVALSDLEAHSLVGNLVRNAQDAILEQGSGGRIDLRARIHDGVVHLEVQDDGPGIPSANRERIFDAFFSTKPEQGTGLGLSIVHKLVASMGGSIALDSLPGHGTQFTVTLPIESPSPVHDSNFSNGGHYANA